MNNDLTRRSLLVRVREATDVAAWAEFEQRYGELITRYGRIRGLQPSDADDVCQIVMTKLARAMRVFEYDPKKGRFRNYLYRIVQNEIIQQFARPKRPAGNIDTPMMASLAADDGSRADEAWEREWENHHLRLAMQTIRATFEPRSVEVFDRLLGGASVEQAAEAFEMTTQAVHKIKQRVGKRLRELIEQQVREEDEPDRALP